MVVFQAGNSSHCLVFQLMSVQNVLQKDNIALVLVSNSIFIRSSVDVPGFIFSFQTKRVGVWETEVVSFLCGMMAVN